MRENKLNEFLRYLQESYNHSENQAALSDMDDAPYWAGRLDAYDELLEFLDRICEDE
jgi:hypothetical protein